MCSLCNKQFHIQRRVEHFHTAILLLGLHDLWPSFREWYHPSAILLSATFSQRVISALYDLSDVDFDLPVEGIDLDELWPSFVLWVDPYWVYSGTSLIWTPYRPKYLSWLVRCPYFRERIIYISCDSVKNVSWLTRCPLRGVPLYTCSLITSRVYDDVIFKNRKWLHNALLPA